MAARYVYGDGPDGSSSLSIGLIALPCPGVALRLNAVIDCTPGEHRMPPVTIDFLTKNPSGEAVPAAAAGHFTCNSGDFVLFGQLRRVEAMVAAAGLPRECAPSVEEFFHLSASSAANSFYKAVAITVEAGAPGSIAVDEYEDEDEEVPPGAVVGECAICYKDYVVGGATSLKLPCTHTFHRKCLGRWTAVKRTCPYCRSSVPEEHEYWDDEVEDDCDDEESEYDVPREEYGSSVAADGNSLELEVTAAPPSSTWSRICIIALLLLLFVRVGHFASTML